MGHSSLLVLSRTRRGSCDHWREEFLLQHCVLPCQVQSHTVAREGGKRKKKKKKCYSYSYNDPILTAMCCVHKIFYFFPEAKWPFVNTLVNVQWSKWIFKQVLYQIPAMMTLQGAVSALHQYTEWCVPRVGGKEKRKKQQLVIYRFIHHWGKRCTGGMFCSWMVSSFEFFPPPPQNVINSHFFFK